jgi:hypothetical protein
MKLALFVGLGIVTVLYLAVLAGAVLRTRQARPTLLETALGFVTAFFDTLPLTARAKPRLVERSIPL